MGENESERMAVSKMLQNIEREGEKQRQKKEAALKSFEMPAWRANGKVKYI